MDLTLDAVELALARDGAFKALAVVRLLAVLGPQPVEALAIACPALEKDLDILLTDLYHREVISGSEPIRLTHRDGTPVQLELLATPPLRKRNKRYTVVYGPADSKYVDVLTVFQHAQSIGLVAPEARLLNKDGTDVAVKDWGTGVIHGRYFAIREALERYTVQDLKDTLDWVLHDKYWSRKFEAARFFTPTNLDAVVAETRSKAPVQKAALLRSTAPTNTHATRQ